MENKSYCVYCHTNKINGKKYIGQTCQNPPEKRWGENGKLYLTKEKSTGEYMQSKFARAIEKYGWDNFDHEILKTNLSSQEADKWEKYFISFYNSIKEGYNLTSRGKDFKKAEESRKKQSERMIGEKHFNYGKHLSDETKAKISKSLTRKKIPSEVVEKRANSLRGRKQSKEERESRSKSALNSPKVKARIKEVFCVELEKQFSSSREAESFINLKRGHIQECCKNKGKQKTAGGYHWIYVEDIDKENWKQQKEEILSNIPYDGFGKKVVCIETQIVYKSIKEAQRQTNIDSASIGRCCQGKAQTAGKLHWAYYNEEEKEEKL